MVFLFNTWDIWNDPQWPILFRLKYTNHQQPLLSFWLYGDCRATFCWQPRSARHWATPGAVCNTRPGGRTGSGGIHHGMLDTKGPPHDLRPSRIGHVPWNLEFVHRCWSGSETYLRDIWWYRISKLHPLQHYFEVNTGVNGLRQPQLWSPADIVLLTKPRNTRRHVAVCDVAVPRMADSADESGSSNWGGFRGPLSDSLGNGHSKRIQFLPEIGWSEVYTILYH